MGQEQQQQQQQQHTKRKFKTVAFLINFSHWSIPKKLYPEWIIKAAHVLSGEGNT